MSQQSLEQFYQIIKNSEELQRELAKTQDKTSFNELAAKLGQDNGYTFTPEEVDTFVSERINNASVELQDEELELVAGAKKPKTCPLNTRFTVCFIRSGCWGSRC
jgi:predicted ribosomally synthesized peptide with nif11-like leader